MKSCYEDWHKYYLDLIAVMLLYCTDVHMLNYPYNPKQAGN